MAEGDKIEITQEDLNKKIQEAVGEVTSKLESKNQELLDELKKARARVKDFADLDPSEVRKALDTLKESSRKNLEDKEEYAKALEEEQARHAKELAAALKAADSAKAQLTDMRVQVTLDGALDEAGVAAPYKKAVKTMHKNNVTIKENDDGTFEALIDDKPVGEALKGWAESDEGRYFVGDSGASGGGAHGGKGNSSGQVNPWDKTTRNLTMQGQLERDNPKLAEKLKREAGVSA